MVSPLRMKRLVAELTIYDVSAKTGIDPARISLIERGYKAPREDEKKKFSLALGIGVGEIFPGESKSSEAGVT